MLSSHSSPSPSLSLALSDWPLLSVRSEPTVLKSPFHNPTLPPPNDKPLPYSLFSLFRKNHAKLNPSFSISSALFKKEYSRNLFPINNFRTLLQNTGGGGTSFQFTIAIRSAISTSLIHCFFTSPSLPFHTPTPVTPIPSCAYFTVLCIPNFFQFPPPSPLTSHCACPLPNQKQASTPAVIHPSGQVCPGGA